MPYKDIEKRRQNTKKWKQQNPEAAAKHNRDSVSRWRAANKGKNAIYSATLRRSKVLRISPNEYTDALWEEHVAIKKQNGIDKAKASQKKQKQKLSENIRRYIWDYKTKNPCILCGFSHPAALVFHHRNPQEKEKPIGGGKFSSMQKLLTEIEKCDILCSNCHLIHHHTERIESRKGT